MTVLAKHANRARFAMHLSLVVGVLMLFGKIGAWWVTGSAAIFSDAAESVVHLVAVGFASFSLWLSYRPADERFQYGYERVSFFSAGFEGAMIMLAAIFIVVEATERWRAGAFPERLGTGTLIVSAASAINLLLGAFLVRTGRQERSLIVEANGKHVLTDSWTSFGVVAGLLLVIWTGWKPFDPLLAIAVALNILWSGGKLVADSVKGLMDWADPQAGERIRSEMDRICHQRGVEYHELRYRNTGGRTLIVVHLLFSSGATLRDAHTIATEVEAELIARLDFPAEMITHLESVEDHDVIHRLA